jgi:hypothetical protein
MRVHRLGAVSCLPWLAVAACSGGDTSGTDAGDGFGDNGFGMEITPPAPPDIPWLDVGEPPIAPPQMTPCPTGWREVTDPESGTVTCDPWPETGHEECTAVDEAHFPGEPGCTRIGTPCLPDDDWATGLPSDHPIRYVLAGAPPGGDGTRASPFGAIAEAMAGITSGTIVAVGKGTYDEVVLVAGNVTLWGACVAETVLTCSTPTDIAGAVTPNGLDATVRNLRIEGGRRPGIGVSTASHSVHLEDVVVSAVMFYGVLADLGSSLSAQGLVIRNTQGRENDHLFGCGLAVQQGARVTVTRAVFDRNREFGVFAAGTGATLNLTDVAIQDTQSQESDRQFGDALRVQQGSHVTVVRATFERNRSGGVTASGAGTTVDLSDVLVQDTQSQESDRRFGRGLGAQEGAQVTVARAVFERNRDVGVFVASTGTTVDLADVVVRDTQSRESDRQLGPGLQAQDASHVAVARVMFERNLSVGVYVTAGATVGLADTIIRDTQPQESDLDRGIGLLVENGGRVTATRAIVERNRLAGVSALGAGTTLGMTDVIVRDTQSREDDLQLGHGLAAGEGARVTVSRAIFDRNREVAVVIDGSGTTFELNDAVVRDTQSTESDSGLGIGLVAGGSARVTVGRAVFVWNRDVAVLRARSKITV